MVFADALLLFIDLFSFSLFVLMESWSLRMPHFKLRGPSFWVFLVLLMIFLLLLFLLMVSWPLQMPHYHLKEATEAIKPIMKDYYRVPEKSKGPIPFHLVSHLVRSFQSDHYVADEGDVVYYQKDPQFAANLKASQSK